MQTKTWSDERQRTNPDLVVYLPEQENAFDAVNQHFLVTKTPGGAWLAIWTQAADEGEINQSVVSSRSIDRGKTWTEPIVVAGPAETIDKTVIAPDKSKGDWRTPDTNEQEGRRHAGIASWGFPIVVPELSRIYCFYCQNDGIAEYRYDLCGMLRGKWSDDDGATWSAKTVELPIRRTVLDHPDERFPVNWIVFQVPYVTAQKEVIAPFTRWAARASAFANGSECWFLRFDNILTEPDPYKLRTTTLPDGRHGLRVPHFEDTANTFAEEPSMVELSDGRFYCVMRTSVGYIAFSISNDRGHTWSTPAPLYRDNENELMLNPVVPAPIYQLNDGRYVLLYYHNNGDAHGGYFPCGYACFRTNRYPAYISLGLEDPGNTFQPIRFGPPKVFINSDGHALGPAARTDDATYPSLLQDGTDRILFYPDRKHFLLGKYLTDQWLCDCGP